MNPQWIIDLLKLSPGLIFAFGFIYLLLNPEKAEKWGSLLYKLFCFVSLSAEKRYIALNIQGQINSFQKAINKEVEGLLPYGIKIDWVGEDITPESFVAEQMVIIRLRHHKNRDENLIRILSEYLAKALVPEIKHHLKKETKQAIDYATMRKILKKAPSALNRFYETVYKPEVEKNREIEEYCKMMEDLDKHGYFTRIFLRELKDLGMEVKDSFPSENIDKEIKEFLQFLHRIAIKKREEDVPLQFIGDYIKTCLVLIARPEIMSLDPHKERIKKNIFAGVRSFYLLGRGRNVELVKTMAKEIDKWENTRRLDTIQTFKIKYEGKKLNSICLRYIVLSSEKHL